MLHSVSPPSRLINILGLKYASEAQQPETGWEVMGGGCHKGPGREGEGAADCTATETLLPAGAFPTQISMTDIIVRAARQILLSTDQTG